MIIPNFWTSSGVRSEQLSVTTLTIILCPGETEFFWESEVIPARLYNHNVVAHPEPLQPQDDIPHGFSGLYPQLQ